MYATRRQGSKSVCPRHVYNKDYYKADMENRDIWRNAQMDTSCDVLLLGDSIVKYVDGLFNTQIVAFRGIHASQLGARILHDKIPELRGKKLCVVFVGTNNLSDPKVSVDESLNQLHFVIDMIRQFNYSAAIAICHVIPRPQNWATTGDKFEEYNCKLSKYKKPWGFEIIPCSRPFFSDSVPIRSLYAFDKIHLLPDGTETLKNYISRVLGNIKHRLGIPKGTYAPQTKVWQKIK